MAQLLHPQPQEDLPCFLFLRSDSIIDTTAAISTAHIIIDERFSVINFNIINPPLIQSVYALAFTADTALPDSLYGLNSI